MPKLYIGTSGWMYKDWGKTFYPKDLHRGHLSFLAQEFSTVEVNTSFYHLPRASTFFKWASEVPSEFIFAVKLSRFITHQKKLAGVRAPLYNFFSRAKETGKKLGVILIQLPPSLPYDERLLKHFLADLQATTRRAKIKARFALEPRHFTWMDNGKEVVELLRPEKIALVFPHSAKIPSFDPTPENITADFVYVRFHGPSEFAASRYGRARLKPWAVRIREWQEKNLDVFVYFNNDIHGHAIEDARTLKRLIANSS
jgi:uncharacterized protein YecE (DUF72 family)